MARTILLLILSLSASGCMQMKMLPHLDQALVLKDFGDDKDAQHKYVASVDGKFDELLVAIKSGGISKYKTEKDVVEKFGPPVFCTTAESEGKTVKQCLYRYAIQSKSPQRVYLFYDQNGGLVRFAAPSLG